jgi:hypothetical protein
MSLRTISRSAVGGYVKLVRLPLDAAIRLRPRNRGNGQPAGTIALDRFEARLRSIAGRTLRDEELVQDADRRRLAADERERAEHLRAEADRRTAHAEAQAMDKSTKAEQQRRRASERAAQRKKLAGNRRRAETRRIADVKARRRRANKNGAARKEDAIDDRAKRVRLKQLDREADALAKKQDALTAKSEAERLRRTASRTKAARKRSRA